jgi:uncharacterized damage-inducible protein DinB
VNREAGALAAVLRLNTRLFERCLERLSDAEAEERVGSGNSMGFIALHVVDARFYLTRLLGQPVDDPFPEFAEVRSNDEVDRLPALDTLRASWRDISPRVVAALESLTPEQARAEASSGFPIDDPSVLGTAAFLVQHESYHIGQLSVLRRQLGHPSIDWT